MGCHSWVGDCVTGGRYDIADGGGVGLDGCGGLGEVIVGGGVGGDGDGLGPGQVLQDG